MQTQDNSSSCLPLLVAPLFIGVALVLIAAGWAIDNGYLTDPGDIAEAFHAATPNVVVVPNGEQSGQVVIPNGEQAGQVVIPAPSGQVVIPAPSGQVVVPDSNALREMAGQLPVIGELMGEPEMAAASESAWEVTSQPVMTGTMTPQPVITVTATLPPIVIVTGTPINQPALDASSGCTTAGVGISCGTAPTFTPIPPTMLPRHASVANNHGMGGDVPLGPTPEVIEVRPHEEVTPPPVEVFVIKDVFEWGDVTVRSTFNGQQAGYVCYSSKYDGQVMTCPPPDILTKWKSTHQVEVKILGEEETSGVYEAQPVSQAQVVVIEQSVPTLTPIPVLSPVPSPTFTPIPPTSVPPTMLPSQTSVANNHGYGGDVPLEPTPEVVPVRPHEEVTPPPVEVFVIKDVEGWGDVTVRSTFNGQQAGHVCYSAKYDGQVMTCPPPDLLSEWKSTHEVEVRR